MNFITLITLHLFLGGYNLNKIVLDWLMLNVYLVNIIPFLNFQRNPTFLPL